MRTEKNKGHTMSKVSKAAKAGKTPEEMSGWNPRITERPLPSGNTAWQADWWEKREKPEKGFAHRKKQFPTRAGLDEWIAGEHKRRADKRAADERNAELARQAERRGDHVVTLANLAPTERAALAQAIEALRAAGGRVEAVADAVAVYRETHLQGAKKTVADVVEEQLEEIRDTRRPATYADRRRTLAPLVDELGAEMIGAVTRATARAWIMGANTPSMRAARKRALHALFAYAWAKDYVDGNPVAKIKVETPVRDEVEILRPEDAAEVLRRAEKHAPELVPYLAIGLFAGVRPMNELRGIVWERDIDWQDNRIIVKRASSKTNRARSVPMSKNLRAWLESVPKAKRKGRVFYSRRLLDWMTGREPIQDRRIKRPGALAATYKKKGRKPRKRLPPLPWGQDIMRHTRTTYRLGETKNAALVAEEGGHTQAIMELHYVNRTIPQSDVKKFWSIMPTPTGSKGRKGSRK